MLIKKFKEQLALSPAEFQIILEIALDRAEFVDVAETLTKVDYTQFDVDNFQDAYYRYLGELGLSADDISKVKERVFKYTLEKSRDDLLSEVIKTEFITEVVMKILKNKLKHFKSDISPNDIKEYVIQKFSEYAGRYSTEHFELSSGNVVPYIIHCFGYYFDSNVMDILNYGSQQSTSVKMSDGEESVYSVDINLSLNVNMKRELPNFKKLASNILYASELLYNHNGEIFYDLWARVQDKIVNERCNQAKKCIRKELNYSNATRIIFTEPHSREKADNDQYRSGMFNVREKLVQAFESKYNKLFTPKLYKSIYNDLLVINASVPAANNRRFFKGDKMQRGDVDDKDKFMALVFAFGAIDELLKYLDSEGIDPLTVPYTVFRKRKYLNRFNSFSEYMKLHDTVVQLVENAPALQTGLGVPSNDTISDYLYEQQVIGLGRLRLVDIKKVLEGAVTSDFNTQLLTNEERRKCEYYARRYGKSRVAYDSVEKRCINYAIQLDNKGIKIFRDRNYENSHIYKWLKPAKQLDIFAKSEELKKYMSAEYPDLWEQLPKDENVLFNDIRFASLCKVICDKLYCITSALSRVTKRLDLLDVISTYEAYIDLPDQIVSLKEISNLLNATHVILCKVVGYEDNSDAYIATIYNAIMERNKDVFEMLRAIRDREYDMLKSNGVQANSIFEKYKEKLSLLARTLTSTCSNRKLGNQKFSRFLSNCKLNEEGYVLSKNCPVIKEKYGFIYFLHSFGYWLSPQTDTELQRLSIDNEDFEETV